MSVSVKTIKCIVILYLLVLTDLAKASDQSCEATDCIDTNSWQLGIAVGLGARSNPLSGGDDIPLVILPDIAWYGESWYFDNGELGYQWNPSPTTSIEWFLTPNTEKANFSFWHTANVLIPAASLGSDIPDNAAPPEDNVFEPYELDVDDIGSRRWALDGGFRFQWHINSHHVRLTTKTDVSNVHNGYQLDFDYRYQLLVDDWRFSVAPSVSWLSSNLTNYYYGVSEQDTDNSRLIYVGRSGFQVGLGLSANYTINEQWHVLLRADFTKLHRGMTDSPIVSDTSIKSAFAGLAYRF